MGRPIPQPEFATGDTFNHWTLLEPVAPHKWSVKCVCGKIRIHSTYRIRHKIPQSCGCQTQRSEIDLAGQQLKNWTVLERSKTTKHMWSCRCVCGTLADISANSLRHSTKRQACRACLKKEWKNDPTKIPAWKGGRRITKQGYVVVHPSLFPDVWEWYPERKILKEHIAVMSRKMGRRLYEDETVHHKNGIRHDNRLDNLELWSSNHAAGQRVEDLMAWANEIFSRYGTQK